MTKEQLQRREELANARYCDSVWPDNGEKYRIVFAEGYDAGFSDAKESLSEGVHTCHDQCQRVACVQRRKIEELEGKLKIATDAMQEADLWRIDKCLASNLDSDFNVLRDILYLALIKIKYDEKVII